jgi:hypothetical protein
MFTATASSLAVAVITTPPPSMWGATEDGTPRGLLSTFLACMASEALPHQVIAAAVSDRRLARSVAMPLPRR